MDVTTETISTPIGKLSIIIKHDLLVRVILNSNQPITCKLNQVSQNILRYFTQPTLDFDIKIDLCGTSYQQKVWRALQHIPQGTVLSYGQLAKQLQSSPRAIGQACKRNPVPIVIPCHRVVSQQHVGGFAGQTSGNLIDIKNWLLAHEGVPCDA